MPGGRRGPGARPVKSESGRLRLMFRRVIYTPMGSSIEALGQGRYRVCDSARHCMDVEGLWSAGELVREMEVHHRTPGSVDRGP